MAKKPRPGDLAYDPSPSLNGKKRQGSGEYLPMKRIPGRPAPRGEYSENEWKVAQKVASRVKDATAGYTGSMAGRMKPPKPKPGPGKALIDGAKKTLDGMDKPRRMNRGPL